MGRLHEIIIAPILFFLKPVFIKHPLVTPRFLFFFPDFLLFLFFLLLPGQLCGIARCMTYGQG